MPKSLNIQDIMEMLPHRFPFLLIDRVVELSDELDRVVAIKNVTMNEPQFTGHFPQAPVMPVPSLRFPAFPKKCAKRASFILPVLTMPASSASCSLAISS